MHEKRDKTVDILRGLGIVLMIMGHIKIGFQPYDNYFSTWYHSFHMPMFYVVSGYFFNRRNDDESTFIRHKAKTLLVPYVFWGAFHIIYNYILCGFDNVELRSDLINFFTDPTVGGIPIAGALWFFPALFWINVIYFYMSRIFRKQQTLFLISFIVGACGMIASQRGIYLPMAIDAALVGVCFFASGSLMGRIGSSSSLKKHIFYMKWYIFVPLFIGVNYLIFYNGEVNFRSGIYNNILITYANVMIATILLWNMSRTIAVKFSRGIACIFKEILASIGANSLIYVCLNQWMILCIRPAYTSVGGENLAWQCIARMMTLITVCFSCHVVMKVIERNEILRRFVGK